MGGAPTNAERHSGELVSAPGHALSFRLLEAARGPPERLLLLLHGWDGDERQLLALGTRIDPSTLVVLPRGPRSAGEQSFGWYRVSFDGGEPQAVVEEVEDSLAKLVEFIGQLQARHEVAPSDTIVAGFSQGGALAAAVALMQPGCVGGFAMFSGRLLPQVKAQPADAALPPMQAFLAHGRDDTTLGVDWACRADRWLRARGVSCELHLHDGGHELSSAIQREFRAWFADPDRGWNG